MADPKEQSMMRPRGRPKQYDAATAIEAAGQVFWAKGYSATSLDDLAEAMSMNRPSIYRAFGGKEAIYRQALAEFGKGLEAAFAQTMGKEGEIGKALTKFYNAALAVYTSGTEAKGCLVMSTAVTAATSHPEIRKDLLGVIDSLDSKIEQRLEQARSAGQLDQAFDVRGRAVLAQGMLHSLSLRARAGQTPSQLKRMIKSSVQMILG